MILEERYTTIEKRLKDFNYIKVSEIMEAFQVSHETARKYLEVLQERGIAKRVRGGAVFSGSATDANPRFQKRSLEFRKENAVAAFGAAKMVKPGDMVYLDGGMTMAQLAIYLRDIPDITIITNNLIVINELCDCRNVTIYSLSGRYDIETGGYYGPQTEKSLSFFNFDVAFISCAGLSLKQEYVNDFDDRCISRELIKRHAEKLVLVLNSGKINKKFFSNQFPISELDDIFVDSNIEKDEAADLTRIGVNLHIMPMDLNPPSII